MLSDSSLPAGHEEKDEIMSGKELQLKRQVPLHGVEGEELSRAFGEKPLTLMLPSSYRVHRLPRKAERGMGCREEGTANPRAVAFF